jgi:hypothetical protein
MPSPINRKTYLTGAATAENARASTKKTRKNNEAELE